MLKESIRRCLSLLEEADGKLADMTLVAIFLSSTSFDVVVSLPINPNPKAPPKAVECFHRDSLMPIVEEHSKSRQPEILMHGEHI